jgi:predicted butyrate kinase (DUF1464 family)
MKVAGIDPGTKGFSLFGLDGDKVFADKMFATEELVHNTRRLIEMLEGELPLDAIVGPSGYGIPITHIKDSKESDLEFMLPKESEVSVNDAIKSFYHFAKEKELPVYFTPGVIHLQTVPRYRKINRMDMGTADKLCCAALALEQFARRHNVRYSDCNFIFLEVGYGFTAAIGIENGKVVDAVGGTSGFPGLLSPGAVDAELAIRIDKQPQDVVFTGGAQSLAGVEPQELPLHELRKYPDVWNTLIEGAVKDVAAIKVTTPADEIIISGRLARIPEIREELQSRLSNYGEVVALRKSAKLASEAAEGAAMIGIGLIGGEYEELVETLELKQASGTMFDHITMNVKCER